MEPVYTEEYAGYTIEIHQDGDFDASPRDWSNLGVMVCWHNRYVLGDKHSFTDPEAFWEQMARDAIGDQKYDRAMERFDKEYPEFRFFQINRAVDPIDYEAAYKEHNELVAAWEASKAAWIHQQAEKEISWLPLYLMDHSGLSIRTEDYTFRAADSAGWDWGQVGYIYVTREAIKKEYGKVNKGTLAKAVQVMHQEVETYDDYLMGNVWGFVIKNRNGDDLEGEERNENSCWGFIGDYDGEDSALSEARVTIDSWLRQRAQRAAAHAQGLAQAKAFWGLEASHA